MGPVSIPCVLLSEDLLLRLKLVIKSPLTDPSFIVLAGSCAIRSWRCADTEGVGEPGFVRRAGLWRVVFDVVGGFDFMGFLPCHLSRIRSVTERLGRP